MHFQDMTYQRITYEEIASDYEAIGREVQAVSCEADCLAVLKSRCRLGEKMTPIDLCQVRYGMNVNDPFYAEEQRYYDEIGPKIGALTNQLNRLLVESPFRDCFERLMGSFAFSLIRSGLEGYDSRLIALEQEENALVSRYNRLVANAKADYNGRQVSRGSLASEQQSSDRNVRRAVYEAVAASWDAQQTELEEIFDRMVQIRDRQAKTLGYESYVPLSYLRMNRIGYTPEDVARFREQVKQELVPVAGVLHERRKKRLGLDHLYPYDGGISFPEGNPVPMGGEEFCLEMTREMFRRLSPETGEYIDFLLDNGLYDVTPREGKQSGGYCTQFEAYRAPFLFANFDGTSENAYIMSHEGGHGFYFYLKRDEEIRERSWYTPEMAETHAMSMEFFTAPYMELFFGGRAGDYRKMHLEGAVTRILYQCQQDEFQQIVYENPRLTKAERNDVWKRLEEAYFPFREYPDENDRARLGTRWQRIPHTFLWPFYAIDYALAQVCALQYCRWIDADPDGAWQSYLTFCRASGSKNFPEAIEAAGLISPFAEAGLKNLMNWLRTRL
ncbi:MAG: M3 family oligoendopeptidase [Oscillospiraceae bacterium]